MPALGLRERGLPTNAKPEDCSKKVRGFRTTISERLDVEQPAIFARRPMTPGDGPNAPRHRSRTQEVEHRLQLPHRRHLFPRPSNPALRLSGAIADFLAPHVEEPHRRRVSGQDRHGHRHKVCSEPRLASTELLAKALKASMRSTEL